MNERLKELTEQAGAKYFGGKAVVADKGISGLATEFIHSFSELIIQECCEVINAAKPGVDQLPPEVALDMAAKNVKAYFGV
jgi:hypothetical protein